MEIEGYGTITGDLLVPGSPGVQVSGSPTFGGTLIGTGAATPGGYTVKISDHATLGHLRTRTNPVVIPTVAVPPSPTGTRDVHLSAAGQSAGAWGTVRDLTVDGTAGVVTLPPGTYGEIETLFHLKLD